MDPLRRLLSTLIQRWNWDHVIGPDGKAFLAEQEELREKKRRSYYGAIRSHVEAFAASQISGRPDDGYINMATNAELEGIPPTTPPVLTVEDLESFGRAWIHSPYVASEFPTLKEGEYLAIQNAVRDLRDAIREQCALQPALIGAHLSADVELLEARRCDPLPEPDCLTVGEMIDALRVQAMVYPIIGTSKIFFEQWNRREELLKASLGFWEFRSWAQRKHGQHASVEIAEAFRGRLATHLGRDFDEIEQMPLLEAARELALSEGDTGLTVAAPSAGKEQPTALAWLNSFREVLARLHRLTSRIKDESDPQILPIRRVYACIALDGLKKMMENLPGAPVEGDAMTALLKARSLVDCAPWLRDSETAGLIVTSDTDELPITLELQEYAASIDPRSLEDMLHLLSGVPASPGLRTAPPGAAETPLDRPPRVGIITALPLESAAMRAVLGDPRRIDIPGTGAGRVYWMAEIPSAAGDLCRVVIAQAGMGNNVASIRASLLLSHFRSVDSIIMCGIAAGIPDPDKPDEHVRLGDIVVSDIKGVVQYDFVKRSFWRRKPVLEEVRAAFHRPSAELLDAVQVLTADEHFGRRPWERWLAEGLNLLGCERPDPATDVLSGTSSPLVHPFDPKRRDGQPRVFFGPIASANVLLKDPTKRDFLSDKFGVRAVEMEAAGIVDATWTHGIGYLVVRGICDYADVNKNDIWQKYSAVSAASYVRALLESMPAAASRSHR
jgi:nucleoside phosphorylase